jgi:hypothetical protein
MITHSRNSAMTILLILNVVRTKFYQVDLEQLVNRAQEHLHDIHFIDRVVVPLVGESSTQSLQPAFDQLACRFFDYYWSRLPVLVAGNRVQHKGRLSHHETEVLSKRCFAAWLRQGFLGADEFAFSGDCSRFERLTKWFIKSTTREDRIYNQDWLRQSLDKMEALNAGEGNVRSVVTHVVESYFPMFWNTFVARYRESLFYCANLGWFVGDLDTDELVRKNRVET